MLLWQTLALTAALLAGIYSLCTKLALNFKMTVNQFVFWVFIAYFSGSLIFRYDKLDDLVSSENFLFFISVGFLGAVFAIFGNLNDAAAMKSTPNPGFVQAIKNGNSPLILLILLLFFGAEFQYAGVVGIVFIAFGLMFLLSKKKEDYQKGSWLRSAIVATFCFGIMISLINILIAKGYKDPILNLMVLSFFVPFFVYVLAKRSGENLFAVPKKSLIFFLPGVLAGFGAATVSYWAMSLAKEAGANGGWVQAIYNTQSLLAFLLAAAVSSRFPKLLPKEQGGEFSWTKLLGILLVIAGVIIVIFYTKR